MRKSDGSLGEGEPIRRFRRACAILAIAFLLFAIACAAGGIADGLQQPGESESSPVDLARASGVTFYAREAFGDEAAGGRVSELLEKAGFVAASSQNAPSWFEDEILPASYLEGGMALPDWSIVGFAVSEPPEEALDEMGAALAARGWTDVVSNLEGARSFVKSTGSCTWLIISCAAVGDCTSVVMEVR